MRRGAQSEKKSFVTIEIADNGVQIVKWVDANRKAFTWRSDQHSFGEKKNNFSEN